MSSSGLNPDSLEKFYKPYLSDEESSDNDSYSSSVSSEYTSSIASLSDASTFAKPPPPEMRRKPTPTKYAAIVDVSGNTFIPPAGTSGVPYILNQTKTAFVTTKTSTTVMINSRDRDTDVYPYPSFFTIRLPRVYKNVILLNVTQVKLLSSFYYFSDTKSNNMLRINEKGRLNKDIYIDNGTYDASALSTQLQNKLNDAAIYSNITLDKFSELFPNTGDFTLLFNWPGDNTYNNLTGAYDALASKTDIANRYFTNTNTLGIARYTYDNSLVAYYYPLIRDLTIYMSNAAIKAAPTNLNPYLNIPTAFSNLKPKVYPPLDYKDDSPLLNGATYYDRIVFGFKGVDDKYILLLAQDTSNRAILDTYKSENSWQNRLVNRYVCSYDPNAGRFSILTQQLNTSIHNDLTNQYTNYLTAALITNGLNPAQVIGLTTAAQNLNSAIIDMYNFLQKQFVTYFGVNNGAYSSVFFSNAENKVFIYDAAGRYGWNLAYSGTNTIDSSAVVYADAPAYWKNLAISSSSAISIDGEIYYPNPGGDGNVRYTFTDNALSDASGNIILLGSSETTFGYQDIPFSLIPTSYFKTSIKSSCRQTLYIETLPSLDGSQFEKFYMAPKTTPLLFDKLGNYLVDTDAPDFNFYDISQNMLDGADFMRSLDNKGNGVYLSFVKELKPAVNSNLTNGSISLFPYQNHIFFKLNHGGYPIPSPNLTKFPSDIYIEREDGKPFGVSIDFYWYRDRSAFMADVKSAVSNTYVFNPRFYMKKLTIDASVSSYVFTTDVISYENSYIMMLASSLAEKMPLRMFVVRNKPYGEYSIIESPNDLSLRRLPTDLQFLNTKATPSTLVPVDYTSIFDAPKFRNAYDKNGVSNNLLNYVICTTDFLHYDPFNFTDLSDYRRSPMRYVFKHISPAVISAPADGFWSQYFYSGSQNLIMEGDRLTYYDSNTALSEPVPYFENEYIFTSWFRAGATENLFSGSTVNPADYPETVLLPTSVGSFDAFSYTNTDYSPFSLCLIKETPKYIDVSLQDLSGLNLDKVFGIPFLPPPAATVLPTKIVLKFGYFQPLYSSTGMIGRNTPLQLLNGAKYTYDDFSVSTIVKDPVADLGLWDDKYISNRKNIVLGVFYCKDVYGKPVGSINLANAISTLTLKKVVQTGSWNSSSDGENSTKKRAPEWGTYYVYEKMDAAQNMWVPSEQSIDGDKCTTRWATYNKGADISNYSYTGGFQEETEIGSYYSDVSGNSLVFIPFYPSGSPSSSDFSSWVVGSFTGLTYTERPFLPFAKSAGFAINPYLYYKTNQSICVEDVSGAGLAFGTQSSYYGICGPFCLGSSGDEVRISNFNSKPTFFNIRVNLVKKRVAYNPITDLSKFPAPMKCYNYTQAYLYNDTVSPYMSFLDIKSGWGQEKASNFINYNDSDGYNYQSFFNKCDISADNRYDVNIRSILPTTAFSGTLRISGKNWTDFGFLSLQQLCSEIDDLVNNGVSISDNGDLINNAYRVKKKYSYNYTLALLKFNAAFSGSFKFGIGFTNPLYGGISITSSGFTDFLNQYISTYTNVNRSAAPIQNAQNLALTNIKKYITTNYTGVLPDYALIRDVYTDPLVFSILFKSALTGNYIKSFDQWGLGWNLGFLKIDTPYSTRQVSHTFIRIIDDFIYLKLNEEFNMNTIDTSDKEYLNKNRDATGQNKAYFGKLLLNTFGSYSQTFIQSSKGIVVPLGKLDKLSFTWYDANNNQIINPDCEFNIVIDVAESLDWLDPNSVIVKGSGAGGAGKSGSGAVISGRDMGSSDNDINSEKNANNSRYKN